MSHRDWANTICFCAHKNWLLTTIEKNIDEMFSSKLFIETVLYRSLIETSVKVIQIYPIIDGICAGLNKPYPNAGILYRKTNFNFTLSQIYKARQDWAKFIVYAISGAFYRMLRIAQVFPKRIFGK